MKNQKIEEKLINEANKIHKIISLAKTLRLGTCTDYLNEKLDENDVLNIMEIIEMMGSNSFRELMNISEEI